MPDHLPGVDFSKQLGRPDDELDEIDEKEELILDPSDALTKKTQGIGGAIPMAKQVGRPT